MKNLFYLSIFAVLIFTLFIIDNHVAYGVLTYQYQSTLGVTGVAGSDNAHFNDPIGVAVDSSGNVYVADNVNNRVQIFNSAGIYQSTLGVTGVVGNDSAHFYNPRGVAVDSSGHIYVADYGNQRIQIFNSAGIYQSTLGVTNVVGSDNAHFNDPIGIAVDSSGNVYVADSGNSRVQIFNSAGIYQSTLGVTGVAGSDNTHFSVLWDIAVEPSGKNIYVADSGNQRIQIFNSAGIYQSTLGVTGVQGSDNTHFSIPIGVAVDSSGNVYVANNGNNLVQIFNSAGIYQSTLGVTGVVGNDSAHLISPRGIAVGPSGKVYVADQYNNRVQIFTLANSSSTFLTKTANATNITTGQSVLFTYNETNDGATSLTNVSVTDNSCSPVQPIINPSTGYNIGDLTNRLILDQGESWKFQCIKTFNTAGTFTNTAIGNGTDPSGQHITYPSYTNETANATVTVTGSSTEFTNGQSASLVIGQPDFVSNIPNNGGLAANSLYFPTRMVFDSSGNLWVADLDNNRVLEYTAPFSTHESASLVIGQPDFISNNANNGGVSASSLSHPTRVTFDKIGNLWVGDAGNARVLEYAAPFSTHESASLVIGQPDFVSNTRPVPSATSLYDPLGLAFDSSGNLWVADQSNDRILEYAAPFSTHESASLVIGQSLFTTNANPNPPNSQSLALPHDLAFDSVGNLWVSSGDARILEYAAPFSTHEAATIVIGQPDFATFTQPNPPTSQSLSSAGGISFDLVGNLWVSDYPNNRVLQYRSPFTTHEAASVVIGQPDFVSNTQNNGGISPSSLNNPADVTFDKTGNLWVADELNNRILEYINAVPNTAASIMLNPTSSPAGSQVVITGTNFTPGNIITVYFDEANIPTSGAPVDSSGTIIISTGVPSSATAGTHTILVSDTSGKSASAAFTVASSTPQGESVQSATGAGLVSFSTSSGIFSGLSAVSPSSLNPPPPPRAYPYGFFDWTVSGFSGNSITITITYPDPLPTGSEYEKLVGGTTWVAIPAIISGNTMTMTITDNGPYDANPDVGVISDPGGLGIISVPTISTQGQIFTWITGIAVIAIISGMGSWLAVRHRHHK